MILRTEAFLVFIATCRWRWGGWWRWERSLLVLYHVHVLVLLRGVHVGREALGAHRAAHRGVRGEPEVRRRVAGMRHVVPGLALVVEVVHLRVVRGVVVVGIVLIIVVVPEAVRLVVGNVGRQGVVAARLRRDRRWGRRHDGRVRAERREIAAGLAEARVDVEIWWVMHRRAH